MSSTGDYEVADTVYYTGTVEDGDRLVHGQQGEGTKETYIDEDGDRVVAALFPESKCSVECNPATVRQHTT